MADKLRWGILSTAQIARKNWKAISHSGNSTVVGVASRDANRCRQFIAECQSDCPMEAPPTAFASYEELLASKEIDAVYIPLPTGVGFWTTNSIQLGALKALKASQNRSIKRSYGLLKSGYRTGPVSV